MNTDKSLTDSKEAARQQNLFRHWKKEIEASRKREKDYRTGARELVRIYESERNDQNPYNILFSNTETLGPAVYNSIPRPVVKRRFDDEDPLGKLASQAGARILSYLLDDGMADYATFDELMKSAVTEGLVPGRGVTWLRYDAVLITAQNVKEAEAAESESSEESNDTDPENSPVIPQEEVGWECVVGEEVPWDRFLHGYAKKWKDVPWVGRDHFLSKEDLEKNFGAIAANIPMRDSEGDEDSSDGSIKKDAGEKENVAHIVEIWDKISRKVIFIAPSWRDRIVKETDDPLNLSGFFPCAKPLQFYPKIDSLTPVPLYKVYEQQAKELNRVTTRITRLIEALKVRGLYDAQVEKIEKLLTADDNTLVPADNVAALYANSGSGIDKSIWLFPIEKLVPVLQQLYNQRQQIKTVIFEITGIADIMRGSSVASETLGAQELKNQWGTLRLKRFQKEVSRYARDNLRIMLEIAVSHCSEETLAGMTGMQLPTAAQKEQAKLVAQQVQMSGQQELPPEIAATLASPSWSDVFGLLKDDLQRSFRIDIETNSTIDAEATEDKQDMTEVLTAVSQFLSGVSPLVQSGVMPFDVAKQMLLVVVRKFRLGGDFEDALAKMKPPEPQQDPKAESQKQQAAIDAETAKRDAQMQERQHQMDLEKMSREAEYQAQEHAIRMAELNRKAEADAQAHAIKLKEMAANVAAAHAMPKRDAKGKN